MTNSIKSFFELFSVYYNVDVDDIEYIRKEWDREEVKTCAYVFTKGPRKNQSCIDRIDHHHYCKLHAGCEGTGQKMKKSHAAPTNYKTRGTIAHDKPVDKPPSIYIVKHRSRGFFWHPESGFIFDKKTRRVISIFSENSISKLNEQDKKICKNYGFKVLLE